MQSRSAAIGLVEHQPLVAAAEQRPRSSRAVKDQVTASA